MICKNCEEEALRDRIAIETMHAIIAKHPPHTSYDDDHDKEDQIARSAYVYADAMLRARRQTYS